MVLDFDFRLILLRYFGLYILKERVKPISNNKSPSSIPAHRNKDNGLAFSPPNSSQQGQESTGEVVLVRTLTQYAHVSKFSPH
ncbi:hypothetical protein YC2023_015687 [Brassica napus]